MESFLFLFLLLFSLLFFLLLLFAAVVPQGGEDLSDLRSSSGSFIGYYAWIGLVSGIFLEINITTHRHTPTPPVHSRVKELLEIRHAIAKGLSRFTWYLFFVRSSLSSSQWVELWIVFEYLHVPDPKKGGQKSEISLAANWRGARLNGAKDA